MCYEYISYYNAKKVILLLFYSIAGTFKRH